MSIPFAFSLFGTYHVFRCELDPPFASFSFIQVLKVVPLHAGQELFNIMACRMSGTKRNLFYVSVEL